MGRKSGQVVRCRCTRCGAIEMRTGCSADFRCITCRPVQLRDDLQYQAHQAVAKAIRAGDLKPVASCRCVDCGAQAEHYDHRDYSKPLEVEPTCRRCNFRRGPAARSASSMTATGAAGHVLAACSSVSRVLVHGPDSPFFAAC